ncbi:MAG: putative protein YqgN [Phycisphaerae bacterium]|nr:putative protein YqgN [Phycisphaerae bacterium]
MKQELRRQMRLLVARVEPRELHECGVAAAELLAATPEFTAARTIMLFLSMAGEIDTAPLGEICWQRGVRVAAPRVLWDELRLVPVLMPSLADVRPGAGGIPEPAGDQEIPLPEINLVVVPGLAFDARGARLGRGRGFYDRFLAQPELRGVSAGMALEEQLVAHVPSSPHDVRVQMLVTHRCIRRFPPEPAT